MKQYSQELKEQVINECREVGNIALVARRHEVSRFTVYSWMRAGRKNGCVKPLPKARDPRVRELEKRLEAVSTENDRLKRLVAEKELELAILKELTTKVNPR